MKTKRLSKTALSLLARAAIFPRIGVGVEHGVDRVGGPFGGRAVAAANELETLHLVVTHRNGPSRCDFKNGRSSVVYSRSLRLRPTTAMTVDGKVVTE